MSSREQFKLRVLQADGARYEELFAQIMRYAYPRFRSVRPHGNIGDRGNDGWIPHLGHYYQVYAPEELEVNSTSAQAKVKADFAILKSYWDTISPIRSFHFVLNDKFKGVSPHISKTMEEIRVSHNLGVAGVFDSADLESILFRLSQDEINAVLGINNIQSDPLYDDRKKVRDFIERFSGAFDELFSLGGEAGYFFPSEVFYDIGSFYGSDWNFERLKSRNSTVAGHQERIRSILISMRNQIEGDHYYQDIGLSFKYVPPHGMAGRDALIENRKGSMRDLVYELRREYESIKGYAP